MELHGRATPNYLNGVGPLSILGQIKSGKGLLVC